MGVGAALGILIGMMLSRPRKNQVWKIVPGDNRGYDLNVLTENALSLHCEPIGTLPPQRFMKFRPGITTQVRGRFGRLSKITRHVGREGTAYSQRVESGEIKNIPLSKTLKVLWGEEDYNRIPKELLPAIEDSKIGITVQLEDDPLTPKGMPIISEENIKTEEDRQASQTFWKGKAEALKGATLQSLAWMGMGGLVVIIGCLAMGWIPIAK